MSESCNQNCNSCSDDCADRKTDLFEKPHELSCIKKVIGIVSGKGGVEPGFRGQNPQAVWTDDTNGAPFSSLLDFCLERPSLLSHLPATR